MNWPVPELPEVETIVRDLRPELTSRLIENPRLFYSDVLYGVTSRKLLAGLRGRRIVEVFRRAKHAVFLLDSGVRLIIQPGMSGVMLVYRGSPSAAEQRYAVLTAELSGGSTFMYRDVRRLGTILLLDEQGWRAYTARIGPEPLADDFRVADLAARLGGSRQAVKKVIMDQHRLAGVGNIYANEALFRARIDPSLPADRLDPSQVARLYRSIRTVLSQAIASQGTTFRDYRTGTGARGSFQFRLHVYGREGRPCRRCGATLAMTHSIDGRATTFCWRCQAVRSLNDA
ncbi:MAG: bifunctional DNA-formamidopyrimidine glycosylase/DNA-(apurinic or apyrimidinic site) lyase [Gemmatimonadetes bacterium]|nr:bifunctional DNA-formamidopyrimidine glycosylase/DNA-(apurinic or apyrimidinic site) lyase [Gemmatimonadota bacterium]